MILSEKKRRLGALLRHLRGTNGYKGFASQQLGGLITFSSYRDWELGKSWPHSTTWLELWPKLCSISGLSKEKIERYLEGECELHDLFEIQDKNDKETVIDVKLKVRYLFSELNLSELVEILNDLARRISEIQQSHLDNAKRQSSTDAKNTLIPEANISNLISAYILLNFQGQAEERINQMANSCELSLDEVKAVLEGRPIQEESAGVFAAKLKISFGEFLNQYPVIRDCAPLAETNGQEEASNHN